MNEISQWIQREGKGHYCPLMKKKTLIVIGSTRQTVSVSLQFPLSLIFFDRQENELK